MDMLNVRCLLEIQMEMMSRWLDELVWSWKRPELEK